MPISKDTVRRPLPKKYQTFIDIVWNFYEHAGRHDLPWRVDTSPYSVLVSELMLQQTQVSRVLPKYQIFMKQFKTIDALAATPLSRVLVAWQGLGYNRRAKMLHQTAKMIVRDYDGVFPVTYQELMELPGVGPYTAGAIMAFAYNDGVPIIETNIRTVYLYHFFKQKDTVTDKEIETLVVKTLDAIRPREWYWALMDYGAHLKRLHGSQNSRSKHYVKQSKFAGSDREIRGAIVRTLAHKRHTEQALIRTLSQFSTSRLTLQLQALIQEGMIQKRDQSYTLSS